MAKRAKSADKRLTNPHGVNQYTGPDPRQALFLQYYFNRESPTFGNALQSGLAAGFEREYAESLTYQRPKWFSEFLGNLDFTDLAEGHLREVLMLPNVTQAMGAFGPVFRKEESFIEKKLKNGKIRKVKQVHKIPVMVANTSVIKEKTAAAKLVLPAHNPAYSNKGPKVKFNFNINATKQKYKAE